jgi:hypothetical protein
MTDRRIGPEFKESVIHNLLFPHSEGSTILARMLAEHWHMDDFFHKEFMIWHGFRRQEKASSCKVKE